MHSHFRKSGLYQLSQYSSAFINHPNADKIALQSIDNTYRPQAERETQLIPGKPKLHFQVNMIRPSKLKQSSEYNTHSQVQWSKMDCQYLTQGKPAHRLGRNGIARLHSPTLSIGCIYKVLHVGTRLTRL